MTETLVSFVIPHKGREQFLQETLRSIALQEFDLSSIEVIVVTQNDKLSEDTLHFQDKLSLSVYPRPAADTIAALRNYGAEKAKGDYLAFLDADVYISSNWATCMLAELNSDHGRALTSGIQRNSEQAKSVERIRTALNNINKNSNVDSLHGSNLFLRAETFRAAGGFPAELRTCEDVYFTNKVGQLGRLYLSSSATFIHLGEDKDHRIMFRKEIWRGLSNLRSFKGRKVPLRELPSLVVPLGLMPLFFVSLLLLIRGIYVPAFISAFFTLTPVMLYSARLHKYSGGQGISLLDLAKFYTVYFSARSIGTYKGLYHTLMIK